VQILKGVLRIALLRFLFSGVWNSIIATESEIKVSSSEDVKDLIASGRWFAAIELSSRLEAKALFSVEQGRNPC
jgi:hypothetical protein